MIKGAFHAPGVRVLSRDGKFTGIQTGGSRQCGMESCRGIRIYVKWEDGTITMPCSKGLRWMPRRKAWRICNVKKE
jgi:hypothetical protein